MENKQIDICNELGQNFIDFSYETNSCRAFADARDGLKPGQRACLWEMYIKGYLSSKAHVKSAKIAGGVVGTWWPHGDVAIYDTFTRMSQKWINNIPEIDWHGNNGSQIVPDAAAASRYTEARLSKVAEEGLFYGIKKENVNMILNYSEDDKWPEVLPAIFPRLMVNGCQGIGSTIANVWLPHNLTEIANIIIKYIDTREIDYSSIFPDFPIGCQITNKNDLVPIYKTGKGKVVLRARAEIKDNHIFFREITYQTYVEPLIEKIKDLILKGELTDIEAIYNRSSKKGIEIDIECSRDPNYVLKQLYQKTDLQKSYSANQWALVGKTPKLLTLKDYIEIYIEHNETCLIKETTFDKAKAEARQEIVEGLLRALEDIDNIIALIKKSKSSTDARDQLITKYNFTENQAKAIVNMKLGSLAGLEKIELQNEHADLLKAITHYFEILNSEELRRKIIRERLEALVKKYGDKRKTELTQINIDPEEKEIAEVVPEDVVVVMTKSGDIKKIPTKNFKVQKRNGKGTKNKEDVLLDTISTNTIDALLLFSNKGKMYRILVDSIPEGTNLTKGTSISSLIKLENDENIIAITSLYHKTAAKYVVFFTKNGLIKKTSLEEYFKVKRSTGIQAIKINEGDSIANVTFLNEEDVIVITEQGMSIHFETTSIAPVGRVAAGIKTIKLLDNDKVLVGLPIHRSTDYIAIFSENGFGKKTKVEDFPIQNRAGKGVLCYKTSSSTGKIIGAEMVDDQDNVLLIGSNSICISTLEIPLLTRNSIGNIMSKNKISKTVKI